MCDDREQRPHVIRYCPMCVRDRTAGLQLAGPRQGRATYATPEEAQAWIDGIWEVNPHDTLHRLYGQKRDMRVGIWECYHHHDPFRFLKTWKPGNPPYVLLPCPCEDAA